MAPLLKNLLGNNSKDRELTDEMRAILAEMQQERVRNEALLTSIRSSSEHLVTLGEPLAKAVSDADAIAARIGELEERFSAMLQLVPKVETLHERVEGLVEGQRRAEAQVIQVLEDARGLRTDFEDIGARIDAANSLRDQLEKFLEVEKPFQQVRDDVGSLRAQVEGTGEHLTKLREQHDRLLDAHKLATTKIEALDRRREELSRDLQDKERRVASVSQSVRGLDGVQSTIDDLKRQIGTLKALGDFVAQKNAALEAQREAVETALTRAENLDKAMKQVDAGMRQQQLNESALGALQDQVTNLQALHESVLERSREITRLQQDTDEQARGMRHDLASAQEELQKAVERFEFESRGLESVSQRVTDVRNALSDFESRFQGLTESSETVASLLNRAHGLAGQLHAMSEEVARIEAETAKLQALRRELDETVRTVQDTGSRVARIEDSRPAVDAALADFEQLRGSHALVQDALEQVRLAHTELNRTREAQAGTRDWLAGVEAATTALRAKVESLQALEPVVTRADEQTRHIAGSLEWIRSQQEFVTELQNRLTSLATQGGSLDERGRELAARMQAAEQRFTGLAAQAAEAERTARVVAESAASLTETVRGTDQVEERLAAAEARCASVEALAERTQTLQKELAQRQQTLQRAKQDLAEATSLRQQAAAAAQHLGELTKQLADGLGVAEDRVLQLGELAGQLEHRATDLQPVEKRLDRFEERMAKWDLVEQDVARSLEQLAARQGTVDALQADLERMLAMAEKTAGEVRAITSAQRDVADSHQLLDGVMARLQQVQELAGTLDERKRQMSRAEERLARAEALLVDVHSSLEALQGQKVLVDQAVEKAGSLRVLVKQAESMAETLREEREIVGRMRVAIGGARQDQDDDLADEADEDDGPVAKAA